MNPELLYNLARELLVTAEGVLTDTGLELPGHRFVSYNAPAWDCCDHLVTHVSALRPARATRRTRASSRSDTGELSLNETDLTITYIGCAAIGDPIPTDTAIDANALTTYSYAWALYQGLICDFTAASLEEEYGVGCKLVKVSALAPHPPMGGCESFTIVFTVQIS